MADLPSPADQIDYWDRVAGEKTFSHHLDLELLARHVPRGGRVLDLGCGYGRVTREVARGGWVAIGADTSAAMVARGRAEVPDLDLRAIEPGPLPFEPASFDAVLLLSVLTCIPGLAHQRALLGEVERVLRPGGVVLVSDLMLQGDARNRTRYDAGDARFGEAGVFELPEGVVLCHFPPERLDELFAPFGVPEREEFDVVTMNGNPARAFRAVLRVP